MGIRKTTRIISAVIAGMAGVRWLATVGAIVSVGMGFLAGPLHAQTSTVNLWPASTANVACGGFGS